MANPKVEQYVVPFEGNLLNTSKYNYDTKPFQGFNKLEGTYYQGCLSPYYKTEKETEDLVLVDNDNNEWEVKYENNKHKLYKNSEYIKTLEYSGNKIIKRELKQEGVATYIRWDNIDVVVCYKGDKVYLYNGIESETPFYDMEFNTDYEFEVHSTLFKQGETSYAALLLGTTHLMVLKGNTAEDVSVYNFKDIENPAENNYIAYCGDPTWFDVDSKMAFAFHLGDKCHILRILNNGTPDLREAKLPSGQDGYWDINIEDLGFFYDPFEKVMMGYMRKSSIKKCNTMLSETLQWSTSHHYRESTCPLIIKNCKWINNQIAFAGGTNDKIYLAPENRTYQSALAYTGVDTHIVRTETTVMGSLRYSMVIEKFQKKGSYEIPSGYFCAIIAGGQFIGTRTLQKNAFFQDDGNFLDGSQQTIGHFRVLANNGYISNISVTENEKTQGTIIENWNTIDETFPIYIFENRAIYRTIDGKVYLVEIEENEEPDLKVFMGRYIYFNDAYGINAYDIMSDKAIRIGSDWNNSLDTGKTELGKEYDGENKYRYLSSFWETELTEKLTAGWFSEKDKKVETSASNNARCINFIEDTANYPTYQSKGFVATSVNQHYQITGVNAISRIDNPMPAHVYEYVEPKVLLGSKAPKWYNFVNYFFDRVSSSPSYKRSYNYDKTYVPQFEGTSYPTDINGNNLLNISPTIDEIDNNYLLYSSIKLDNKRYAQLATINGENLFAYYNGTVSYNVSELFTIAGMTYSILENVIYVSQVKNGIVNTIQPVLNCGGMRFLGALPLNALFYSFNNKHIYSFTGDTNLQDILDISRFGDPKKVLMNTSSQEILLVYDNETLIISNKGTYECPYGLIDTEDKKGKLWLTKNLMAYYSEDKLYKVARYKLDENFEVVPLKIETSYYGLRNNIVSINDTMYYRLYNSEEEDGYIKLKAETLMNGIKETDTKEAKLNKESFDKSSNTYYGRFQPQLQKATSESFMIETTYPLAAMIISNQPETTLVATTGNGTSHNF